MRSDLSFRAPGVLLLIAGGVLLAGRTSFREMRVEPKAGDSGIPAAPAPAEPAAAHTPGIMVASRRDSSDPVDAALAALSNYVGGLSHPDALRLAFQAYYNFKAARPGQVENPYFYFVDYGLDNRTPRGFVFDMSALKVVDGPFTVAHGSGSSRGRNTVPTHFSNTPGSAATSLGLYLTQEIYRFSGKAGGRRYSSVGLRLRGLSGHFNSAARRRGVVVHGAPYVTERDAGRSAGCPAMEQHRARRLIPLLANGGLVFLYSPRDETWMREAPWVHRSITVTTARAG